MPPTCAAGVRLTSVRPACLRPTSPATQLSPATARLMGSLLSGGSRTFPNRYLRVASSLWTTAGLSTMAGQIAVAGQARSRAVVRQVARRAVSTASGARRPRRCASRFAGVGDPPAVPGANGGTAYAAPFIRPNRNMPPAGGNARARVAGRNVLCPAVCCFRNRPRLMSLGSQSLLDCQALRGLFPFSLE
jgi:hypothetical protein